MEGKGKLLWADVWLTDGSRSFSRRSKWLNSIGELAFPSLWWSEKNGSQWKDLLWLTRHWFWSFNVRRAWWSGDSDIVVARKHMLVAFLLFPFFFCWGLLSPTTRQVFSTRLMHLGKHPHRQTVAGAISICSILVEPIKWTIQRNHVWLGRLLSG